MAHGHPPRSRGEQSPTTLPWLTVSYHAHAAACVSQIPRDVAGGALEAVAAIADQSLEFDDFCRLLGPLHFRNKDDSASESESWSDGGASV